MPRSESGRAGRVEKFLVFGILVVIGLILVVAINGAREIDNGPQLADEAGGDSAGQGDLATHRGGGGRNPAAGRNRNQQPLRLNAENRSGAGGAGTGADPVVPRPGSAASRLRSGTTVDGGDPSLEDIIRSISDGGSGAGGMTDLDPGTGIETPEISLLDIDDPILIPSGGPGPTTEEPASDPVTPRGDVARNTRKPETTVPDPVEDAPRGDGSAWLYTVQKGDSLIAISSRFYGRNDHYPEIMVKNRWLSQPRDLCEGHVLAMPEQGLKTRRGLHRGEPTSVGRRTVRAPVLLTATPSGGKYTRIVPRSTHKVARGENLMKIAQNCYGTKSAWLMIFEANRHLLPSADKIREGQVLSLPQGG